MFSTKNPQGVTITPNRSASENPRSADTGFVSHWVSKLRPVCKSVKGWATTVGSDGTQYYIPGWAKYARVPAFYYAGGIHSAMKLNFRIASFDRERLRHV